MSGFRALVIQHEESVPGGYVEQWLDDRGAQTDILRIDADDRRAVVRDYELVVSLGSEVAAFDDVPWVRREEALLREVVDTGVPLIGICFGAQLLASVLGGRGFRLAQPRIGWLPVRTNDESLVQRGPWFEWHYDGFSLPPEATLIAESAAGPEAYVCGRSTGVQFHPEVTPAIVDAWAREDGHKLEDAGIDPERLLAETREREGESRAAARRLFDALFQRVSRDSGPT